MKEKKSILAVIPKFAEEYYKKWHAEHAASKNASDEHQEKDLPAKAVKIDH